MSRTRTKGGVFGREARRRVKAVWQVGNAHARRTPKLRYSWARSRRRKRNREMKNWDISMGIVRMKWICHEGSRRGARPFPLSRPGQIIQHNDLLLATDDDSPDSFQDASRTPQTGAWAAGTIRITIHRTGGSRWEFLASVVNIDVWFDR